MRKWLERNYLLLVADLLNGMILVVLSWGVLALIDWIAATHWCTLVNVLVCGVAITLLSGWGWRWKMYRMTMPEWMRR